MAYRQTNSYDGSTHELQTGGYSDNNGYSNGGQHNAYGATGGRGYSDNQGYNNNGGYGYAIPEKRKKKSKWLIIGLPILLLVIIAAVVGGVLGSRAANNASTSSKSSSGGGSTGTGSATGTGTAAASTQTNAAGKQFGVERIATGTDTYMLPIYPTATNTAIDIVPTFAASTNHSWPTDPDASSISSSSPRSHPRIIAPQYKWDALPNLIANDAYLFGWNATIFANATADYNASPVTYDEDGGLSGSGVLDVARILKVRVKNWAYAYKMTNDTKWIDRAWTELQTAMGNNPSIPFGTDDTRWNPAHFLDLGEFTNAFGVAYDWMYDGWNDTQKSTIRTAIVDYGLNFCLTALNQGNSSWDWWTGTGSEINGNWNCVNNAGCTIGALAILGDDTSGVATQVISKAVTNAEANCMQAVHADGTWSETPNYWYFGTTGAAEMMSALTTAYGSDQGLLASNTAFATTALYHMYVQGMTSLFNYGDHGPNKYSATANSLMYLAGASSTPRYMLYQREQYDASEPWSMFWYDPSVKGAFWDGLPLDRNFNTPSDAWASMRSTWTSNNGLYVAMKAGDMTGHQTHGDIDAGDFVIDAMGQRWAGDLGSGNYLSTGYFSSEAEDSQRWLYYRKRTEGQNCLVIDQLNQNVTSTPPTSFDTTNDTQGASPVMTLNSNSAVYFHTDLTTAYNGTSVKRGIRMLNQRRQVLIQDDIVAPNANTIQWRMHTNATISISSDGKTATLTLANQTCTATIASPSKGASFTQVAATRYSSDPSVPAQSTFDGVLEDGDQDNSPTVVLAINLSGGSYSLQVVFSPDWKDSSSSAYSAPNNVSIDSWSLTSH